MAAHSPNPGTPGPIHRHIKVHHLTTGMDASIGASGGSHTHRDSGHGGQRALQRILNGNGMPLGLPTAIGGAVVFDAEGDPRHY